MSYNVILVPLFGREADGPALRSALGIAQCFNAHVDAMFVHAPPIAMALPLLEGVSQLATSELIKEAEASDAARRTQARRRFDQLVAGLGCQETAHPPRNREPTVAWRDVPGIAEDVIAREGRRSDLLVFGHGTLSADAPDLPMVEAALLASGRPVFLAPDKPSSHPGRTIAIAWNGSLEAAHALAFALPFLQRADSAFILTVISPGADEDEAGRLKDYLAWHDVAADVSIIEPAPESPEAALMHRAAELGADLLVMGGYGHSRVREFLLSGMTRYALHHLEMPILLAH